MMTEPESTKRVVFASVEDYVEKLGGTHVIKKVLIANNGIGAVKCIRSIRRWSYETFGREREVVFVAMATPDDLRANAEYIRMADEFVHVPGGSNVNNYANVNLIVQIAQQYKVDAVWAGWGHASENPRLPNTLDEVGILFLGPPGGPMYALGDKIGSTIIAQSAGVPTIAWNGDGLTVDYKECGTIPKETYDKANVTSTSECVKQVARVGIPVMIKASEGGGGKGIRMVNDASQVEAAFRQVQSEVPGSPIFVMKLAGKSRHLEVQLLADKYGQAIALSGRDCSVQRRHQKILEEGPPIAAEPSVWLEMQRAAVRLAKEVGYINAGTVEYLYADNKFYFLELNPRLQVEHPVTEMITGINLPASQLLVAMGLPLNRIPDIRKFYGCEDPFGDSAIDFDGLAPPKTLGHTIAARITAENPFNGFQPTSGQITEINFRSSRNVWGYFSVDSSGRVHEFADSQIGHVFAWGEDRVEARHNLGIALNDLTIRGEIRTTIEYLKDLIESPDYKANQFDTAWLDARIKANIAVSKTNPVTAVLIGAAISGHKYITENQQAYMGFLERGQLPPATLLCQTYKFQLIYDDVKYHLAVSRSGEITYRVRCNDSSVDVELRDLADGGYLILIGGKSHVAYAKKDVGAIRYIIDGQTCLFPEEYDPTRMCALMGGKLLRYLVDDNTVIQKGAAFAEIEVMKMNMQLNALETGTISFVKPEGAVMEPGDVICTMKLQDPSKVKLTRPFEDQFPVLGDPWPQSLDNMPHHTLERAKARLFNVMAGFSVENDAIECAMQDVRLALENPLLPVLEIEALVARSKNSLPSEFCSAVEEHARLLRLELRSSQSSSVSALLELSASFSREIVALAKGFLPATQQAYDLAKPYADGLVKVELEIYNEIIQQYSNVESVFQRLEMSDNPEKDDVMQELRQENVGNLDLVLRLSLAYLSRKPRDFLVELVLNNCVKIVRSHPGLRRKTAAMMQEVAALQGSHSSLVALEARQYLIELEHPSIEEQLETLIHRLDSNDPQVRQHALSTTTPMLHLLLEISLSKSVEKSIRDTVLSLYIERVYHAFDLVKIQAIGDATKFQFRATAPASKSARLAMANASSFGDLASLVGDVGNDDRSETSSVGINMDGEVEGVYSSDSPSVLRAGSLGDAETQKVGPTVLRDGCILTFTSIEDLEERFREKMSQVPFSYDHGSVNVLHILLGNPTTLGEPILAEELQRFVNSVSLSLEENCIRRITFAVQQKSSHSVMAGHGALFFTYRVSSRFQEDNLVRNIETTFAFQLDLQRLSNFRIRLVPYGKGALYMNQIVHVYEAIPHGGRPKDKRFFVRALVRQAERVKQSVGEYDAFPGLETVFVQALAALESIQDEDHSSRSIRKNHLFMNVLSESQDLDIHYIEGIIQTLYKRYGARLQAQNVSEIEIRVHAVLAQGAPSIPVRVIASNPTGFALNIESYVEASDAFDPSQSIFYSVSESDGGLGSAFAAMGLGPSEKLPSETGSVGSLHRKPLSTPYPVANAFDNRRARAAAMGTSFVFDFPELFRKVVELEWLTLLRQAGSTRTIQIPSRRSLIHVEELVLDTDMDAENEIAPGLCYTNRAPGTNSIGMVAWKMTLKTPEYPEGRIVVVIANDITVSVGSFGTREDKLYYLASKYARENRYPRLYLAANSGARIGIAEEVKGAYKAKWVNESDPTKGYEYLYVDEATYHQLGPDGRRSVIASQVPGTEHYRIDAIVGERPDLGVENLQGSGMIAGETSRAYDEGFTLSYVSGRCIGIGAYLVRLGQRVIQKGKDAPILLTGYQALNSLMGRDVYTSNLQLGGPKVMFANGVSHISVRNDLEGVFKMIQWLAYVPARYGESLPRYPILHIGDTPDRKILVHPQMFTGEFDPRLLITGCDGADGSWQGGFFDRDSFVECLTGWAKTVIVGRARLGKIPMGVIMSEIRTVSAKAPADPAAPESEERIWNQAGQVWFPDSAYKTAQAINDFNREGLPLMIFANWRGFSGGQRDMFDSVLKYGAFIVDALVAYKQPVFVYIPPGGELRGGAWVVVDPTINEEMMEMYAAPEGRGGVLEPPGIVSIKYRKKDLIATAHRLDDVLIGLDAKLRDASPEVETAIGREIKAREELLIPIYHQIAIQFADLHDRPGRMLAKGVIRDVVPWSEARQYFYYRVTRRLMEQQSLRKLRNELPEGVEVNKGMLEEIFNVYNTLSTPQWNNDSIVADWFNSAEAEAALKSFIATKQSQYIEETVIRLGQKDSTAILKGLLGLVGKLQEEEKTEERAHLVQMLRRGVFLLN